MGKLKTYSLFSILIGCFWILAGAGTIVLLVAAMNKKNSMRCKSVEINISGVQNNYFIDKDDVRTILKQMNNGKLEGVAVNKFNLQMMEAALKKNTWIKKAELFFDNNEHLKVDVLEREPVARIFTDLGNSYYLDTSLHVLPLSNKSSARIPVFTGFIETSHFSKADSLLLKDIAVLGEFILNDPFWMAQIDQIDIQPGRNFEMIPKIGNQVILFGDVNNREEKFANLLTFYKKVLAKTGWNKYSQLNVQYKGQVIAVRRDAAGIAYDSLRTIQIMQAVVASTQFRVNDSLSNIQLAPEEQPGIAALESAERDELDEGTVINNNAATSNVLSTKSPQLPQASKLSETTKPQAKTGTKAVTKPTTAKPVIKAPVKTVSSSSNQASTNATKQIIKPSTKPAIKKPVEKKDKPKAMPKAVMPAKNDY